MLIDILFPRFCVGCGFLGSYICLDCQKKLEYINCESCLYCNKKSLFGLTHENCKNKWGLDGAISVFRYNDLLKKIIKTIKYRLATKVFDELCLVLRPDKIVKINFFKTLNKNIFIQPIPLYPAKERERGFNQSYLLSVFWNSFFQFEISSHIIRKKPTLAQAQMIEKRKRFINLRGAFKATAEVYGNNYLLIDDVVTTGITLKEAAKVLKKAGAKTVFALTLAKG